MRLNSVAAILLVLFARPLAGQNLKIPRSCVPDSAERGTLTGVLELRTYPGPPNYEDTATGDKPETGLYLLLDGLSCTPARGDTVGVYSREDLEWIQLILLPEEYRQARQRLRQHVSITGVISPAETGHHHTLLIFTPAEPLRITVLDP